MLISILDRSRTRVGEPDGAALRHSIDRAVRAESLGFHRFWAAEHHAVPGIASGSPAVLLAAAGARTDTIRLGSGGVMLPHHQPLVVAEQFLMLASLHPGRIDLGLGRSLGFTRPVRRALRQETAKEDAFTADVAEVRALLAGTGEVTARPAVPAAHLPAVHLLATGRGVALAASLGLPLVVGGPVLQKSGIAEVLAAYRRDFTPAADGDAPRVMVSLDVYPADTTAEARDLALPEAYAMARTRETGDFGPLEEIGTVRDRLRTGEISARTRDRIESSLATTVLGTHAEVSSRLDEILTRTGADEVMVSTSTTDIRTLADLDRTLVDILH
ncbi:MsnO8 family LLM class oxidoreductase [Brevibacterium litoralis]|uniref:MsnO8 family LLM class oxidoreductase n=1 Tax=Brevibacterium litoralis TaxID=3138935 RepID=UPI0032EBA054